MKGKQFPQKNPPKVLPVTVTGTRVVGLGLGLGLFWGTVFIFQALLLLLSFQPQGANGLRCYQCHYSPDSDGEYNGLPPDPKCLDPDKDGAPSKFCTAPADKSCVKVYEVYKYENGTVAFHFMLRACTEHHINRKYELCTLTAEEKGSFEVSRAGQFELEFGGWRQKSSALKFKSRSKRALVPAIIKSNRCYCDRVKTSNCNNEPGMQATSSAPFCSPLPLRLTLTIPPFLLPLIVYLRGPFHM